MYCRNCGNEIQEGSKFCGKCGNKIENETIKEANTNQNQSYNNSHAYSKKTTKMSFGSWLLILLGGSFVGAIIISLIIMMINSQNGIDIDYPTNINNSSYSENKTNTNSSNKNSSSNTNSNSSNTSTILSLNDVQQDKTFSGFNQANEATRRVLLAGWAYITNRSYQGYPNAQIVKVWIAKSDGYGRFAVNYSFLKNPNTSESTTMETIYVWIKDINDWNKIGFYYYYGQDIGWGTPLPDNIGE